MLQCCNPTQRPQPWWKPWRQYPLEEKSSSLWFFFLGKSFLYILIWRKHRAHFFWDAIEGGWKSYLLLLHLFPTLGEAQHCVFLVLLEQWRLLKETFSLFLILVGFLRRWFLQDHLIPQWLDHFTWLSLLMAFRMTSSSNLLHPAALWHNLGKSASHLCL